MQNFGLIKQRPLSNRTRGNTIYIHCTEILQNSVFDCSDKKLRIKKQLTNNILKTPALLSTFDRRTRN